MKKYLLSLTLLFLATNIFAQQVDVNTAKGRAKAFLNAQQKANKPSRNGLDKADQTPELNLAYTAVRPSDQKTLLYVLNQGDDNGFVIVGGDDAAQQILGYTTSGSFDLNTAPENFLWWMSQYENQISEAIDLQGGVDGPNRKSSKVNVEKEDVSPMLTCTWSQGTPFSNAVNAAVASQTGVSDPGVVTGCVATAMSQLMYYYKYPTTGIGQKTCEQQNITLNSQTYTFTAQANFGNTTYDWSNMKDSYRSSYTTAQANAVATLMYHVGVSVDMKYAPDGSGTSMLNAVNALPTYFGYDKSIIGEYRDYYSDEEWEDMVYNELSNGRPVLYAGTSDTSEAGHAFVCHGYSAADNMYTFNWGWNSAYDGNFALTGTNALRPQGTGIGGASAGSAYTRNQRIVRNAMPDKGGAARAVLCQVPSAKGNVKLTVNSTDYKATPYSYSKSAGTTSAKLYFSYYNTSYGLTDFDFGVKAYDKNTGITEYWNCSSLKELDYGYGYQSYNVSFDLNTITYNGTYVIRPVARPYGSTSDSDWEDVRIYSDEVLPQVIVTGGEEVAAKDLTLALSAAEVQVGRSINVTFDKVYTGSFSFSGYDNTIISVDATGKITGLKEGTTTITVTGEAMYVNGNKLFNETSKQFGITVVSTVKTDPTVTLSASSVIVGNTVLITVEGYDGSTITYESQNPGIATVTAEGLVTGVAVGTATIKVSAPATTLCNAINETLTVTVTDYAFVFTRNAMFNNENNPYSADKALYCFIKNTSASDADLKIYALFMGQAKGVVYTLSKQGVGAGVSTYAGWNLSTLNNYFDIDEEVTVTFYKDQERTVLYEYPTITMKYRDDLSVDFSMTEAGYATFILPFNATIPTADNNGKTVDWKFYNCTELDANNVLHLVEDSKIYRNVPYIVAASENSEPKASSVTGTYTFSGPKAIDADKPTFTEGLLTGVVGDYNYQTDDFVLQKKNGTVCFYRIQSGNSLIGTAAPKNKAFLKYPSSSNDNLDAAYLPGAASTTAISSVVTDEFDPTDKSAGIYSPTGVRQKGLAKGLNILVGADGTVTKVFVK